MNRTLKDISLIGLPFLLLLLFALLFACNTPPDPKYSKNGKQFGVVKGLFRERWWNFYERGNSFEQGEFWQEAAADFKEALKQRDKDQRRARTYGMHFVDYFPHRDLGIAYYHLGRFEDAKKELNTSLSQVETAKAKFYLNKARKALLEVSKIDAAPPRINLYSLKGGEVLNSFNVNLRGEVEDDVYTNKLTINEDPVFVELSAKKIPFSKNIGLKQGPNHIKIKASDLLGKVTEKEITIFADFEGPLLHINNYADGQEVAEKNIVLRGIVADASGISSLHINDQVQIHNKEREVEFTYNLLLAEGNNRVVFKTTDIAGNTTTGVLTLSHVPDQAQNQSSMQDALTYYPKRPAPIRLVLNGFSILDTGQHRLFAANVPRQLESTFQINLKELADTQTAYYDTIYIDGSVTGVYTITSISINNAPLLVIPGKTIYFNQLIELQEGENKFTIAVKDEKGNTATRTVTIIREIPKVHKIGSRMSLAIMPFEPKGEVTAASAMLYDNLFSAFFNQNRFHIVSRGAELEEVLKELKLSETDLVDKRNAIKVGKLVTAEGILMGTVHETENSIEIYARLVNTETSTVLEAKDVYGQDKSLARLQYLTNGLASKFKHSFPLIEGLVIKINGKDIYADFGSVKMIKAEMKFIVFREGDPIVHPVTGKTLGSDTQELGVATVVDVFEDMSIGKLIADFDPGKIKVKDKIVTK
jgi:tetratricopeptide (TPR) repeat protein/TolB-like protein